MGRIVNICSKCEKRVPFMFGFLLEKEIDGKKQVKEGCTICEACAEKLLSEGWKIRVEPWVINFVEIITE